MMLSVNQKVTIGVVVGLLLGFLIGWFAASQYEGGSSKESATEKESESMNEEEGMTEEENVATEEEVAPLPLGSATGGKETLAIEDQLAGMKVEATMATFTEPGWLVIHDDVNGSLGNALGAARFDKGIYLGVVDLLRATVAGKTYFGVIYRDDGDKQFDVKKDAPLRNAAGELLSVSFKAL